MKLKGIIFDVDGTIADTEEIHRQAFNQTFEEFNINWHWSVEDYKEILFISGGKERFRKFLNQDIELKSTIKDPENFISELHKRKSQIYRILLEDDSIELRPGVIRLINEARDTGIKLGIATSSSMANLSTLFYTTMDLEPSELFNSIVTSDTVQVKKPSPAAYECVLAGLGLKAENCIAIEDTQNGNLAALAAGLKTIITTHAYTIDNDFTGASIVTNNLGEPDKAFTLLQGDNFDHSYVDIELLEKIVSAHGFTKSNKISNVVPIK